MLNWHPLLLQLLLLLGVPHLLPAYLAPTH
jgi:hypothetical protein